MTNAEIDRMIEGLNRCFVEEIDDSNCNGCPYDGRRFCYKALRNEIVRALNEARPKKRESRARLPCVCGCKRTSIVYRVGVNEGQYLRCDNCGICSPMSETYIGAVRAWNAMINQMKEVQK